MPHLTFSILSFLLLFTFSLTGQPCPDTDGSGETCLDPIGWCSDSLSYSTCSFQPDPPLVFCGGGATTENSGWIEFIASSNTVSFEFTVISCTDGTGMQAVFFQASQGDCTSLVELACFNSGGAGPNDFTLSTDVIPGHRYLLMIDGYAGDCCNVEIAADGVETNPAPPPTPVIEGDTVVDCRYNSATYYVSNPAPDIDYIWYEPTQPDVVTGDTISLDITGQPDTFQLCVEASIPCNPACSCIDVVILEQVIPKPNSTSFCMLDNAGDTILPLHLSLYLDSIFINHQSGFTYSWFASEFALQTGAPTIDPIIEEPGVHEFYYSVRLDAMCAYTPIDQPLTITVHEPGLQGSFILERTGSFFNVISSIDGSYDTLYWEASNGWTSAEANPVFPINFTGETEICLFLENACGSNVFCQTVKINPDSIIVVKEDKDELPAGPNSDIGITNRSVNAGEKETIRAFPNPTGNVLEIRSPEPMVRCMLHTPKGEMISVFDNPYGLYSQTINTSHLPAGLYYLHINTKGSSQSIPVVLL